MLRDLLHLCCCCQHKQLTFSQSPAAAGPPLSLTYDADPLSVGNALHLQPRLEHIKRAHKCGRQRAWGADRGVGVRARAAGRNTARHMTSAALVDGRSQGPLALTCGSCRPGC